MPFGAVQLHWLKVSVSTTYEIMALLQIRSDSCHEDLGLCSRSSPDLEVGSRAQLRLAAMGQPY